MDFSQWLARKRLELGARRGRRVTQAEVAEKAGISRQYLGFLEAGLNPSTGKPVDVDRELAIRLAEALDASPEEALMVAGFGENLTEPERDLLRRYRKLDPQQEALVRQLLETFVPVPSSPLAPGSWPVGVGV